MKTKLLLLMLITCISKNISAQEKFTPSSINEQVGNTITVCGKVFKTTFVKGLLARPTVISMGNPHPDSLLTLLIRGNIRRRFDYQPEKDLLNRNICVKGKIEMVGGIKQVIINKQEDINFE